MRRDLSSELAFFFEHADTMSQRSVLLISADDLPRRGARSDAAMWSM